MPKLRIHNFSVSLDGYAAGPDQSLDNRWVSVGCSSTTGRFRDPAVSPRAGLVDEMHLAYAPCLLGSGERLWYNLDQAPNGYEIAELVGTPAALHIRFVPKG